ncbi:unnamed protein product [Caenorhabditis bovis]|uniref:protein-serine/threonine phosphatase n=1 Tax=Caenorhabditis bovis TaxID=2654633 RepID=A0A8S1FF44_9PELO|nr:unnamed protein product [Caenorhabditis bovis]
MTYAESRPTAYSSASYTIAPPPRTPVGPSMDMNRKSKKGLDYWNKAEDEQSGITYYYSRHDMQLPNRMRTRPQPTSSRPPYINGAGPARFPTLPTQALSSILAPTPTKPIDVLSPTPPVGLYKNMPAMPRAKLAKIGGNNNNNAASPRKKTEANVVWGGSKKEKWDEDGIAGPSTALACSEKKPSSGRRKPRWSRCMQTLFCCVAPPREIEKIQSNNSRSTNNNNNSNESTSGLSNGTSTPTSKASPAIQLITQINKDGSVTGLPNTASVQNENGENGITYDKSFTDLKMREPERVRRKRLTFQEEIEYRQNYRFLIEWRPGRTPSALEIIKYDLLSKLGKNSIGEKPLLPPLRASDLKKKCLVIDLDETLVHSSFKPVKNPDFVIPVEIDGVEHQVYVLKRPYVDEFLARVGDLFECVLFTASLAKYADPVADLLDKKRVFRGRLFREACVFHKGNYVKDLSRLGRDLNHTLIIDNSPSSYAFHPENAVPVNTWFDDPADRELLDIIPTLEHINEYESVYDSLTTSRPEDGPPSDPLLFNSH